MIILKAEVYHEIDQWLFSVNTIVHMVAINKMEARSRQQEMRLI